MNLWMVRAGLISRATPSGSLSPRVASDGRFGHTAGWRATADADANVRRDLADKALNFPVEFGE